MADDYSQKPSTSVSNGGDFGDPDTLGDDTGQLQQQSVPKILSAGKKMKTKKSNLPGIIYMGSVPPFMTASRLREILGQYGELGRIFLQPEYRINAAGRREKRYTEGWIEYKDKKLAKRVALSLNNGRIGGKRRSRHYDNLWSLKYLHRFKWRHLTEQLNYEKANHRQRMRVEIAQVKREAQFFRDSIDKGKHLRKLEETVLKKRGLWEAYQEQLAKEEENRRKRKTDVDSSETTGKKTAKLLGAVMGGGGE